MHGIGRKPYLNLDSEIDIESLLKLRHEIYAGVAKCSTFTSDYFETDCEFLDQSFSEKLRSYCGGSLTPMWPQLQNFLGSSSETSIEIFENLDSEQKKKFLKLLGGSQPYSTIQLFAGQNWTSNASNFPSLIPWINKLPFTNIHLSQFYLLEALNPTVIHKDIFLKDHEKHKVEFIWIKLTDNKNFFIYDDDTSIKYDVESYSCFFNERDFHGGHPSPNMTLSLKIWGEFHEDFRRKIGVNGQY